MAKKTSKFNFSPKIKLNTTPLIEAWLTVQWVLEPVQIGDPLFRDPFFAFALGHFREGVKSRFSELEELEIAKFPAVELTAYKPHYRFRNSEGDGWPLLQLGPGTSTVNFTQEYTWEIFKDAALFMRKKLIEAYKETTLQTKALSLRYRNAVPCEYSSSNVLEYLSSKLNVSFGVPKYIPSKAAAVQRPDEINLNVVYKLLEPKGKGVLRIGTGTKKAEGQVAGQDIGMEHIIFETEIISTDTDAPSINAQLDFDNWLTAAHDIAHEWFFSLIDGPLCEHYKSGKED